LPILDDAVGYWFYKLKLLESCWFGLLFLNFAVVLILDDVVRIPKLSFLSFCGADGLARHVGSSNHTPSPCWKGESQGPQKCVVVVDHDGRENVVWARSSPDK
jgi:hypothetical protein